MLGFQRTCTVAAKPLPKTKPHSYQRRRDKLNADRQFPTTTISRINSQLSYSNKNHLLLSSLLSRHHYLTARRKSLTEIIAPFHPLIILGRQPISQPDSQSPTSLPLLCTPPDHRSLLPHVTNNSSHNSLETPSPTSHKTPKPEGRCFNVIHYCQLCLGWLMPRHSRA